MRDCTNCSSHQSKNTFQTYFEPSVDCLFHIAETADGRLLYTAMNPSGAAHAGVSIGQILGRTPSQVLGKEVGGAIETSYREQTRPGNRYRHVPACVGAEDTKLKVVSNNSDFRYGTLFL
jgi:hypothetical protein